jgi:hypothetical protein
MVWRMRATTNTKDFQNITLLRHLSLIAAFFHTLYTQKDKRREIEK